MDVNIFSELLEVEIMYIHPFMSEEYRKGLKPYFAEIFTKCVGNFCSKRV